MSESDSEDYQRHNPIGRDDEEEDDHHHPIGRDYGYSGSDRNSSENSDSDSDSSYDEDDYHNTRFSPSHSEIDHYSSDENTTTPSTTQTWWQRQRQRKRFKSSKSQDLDRISTLPDPILHQILSSIDTKLVVRSSVISKRWRFLWKEVPCLNFNYPRSNSKSKEKKAIKKKDFVIFVDRVLLLRDEEANIERFSLSANDLSHLEDWMVVAKRKHVKEFHLEFITQKRSSRMLPNFIFSLDIEVLKIASSNRFLLIPVNMRVAPYLRTIDLSSCTLKSGKENDELNLKCPSLENFRMSHCDHRNISVLQISAPRLKTLVLENKSSDHTSHCRLRIFTPCITSVVLKGTTYREYFFANLESLVNATFDLEKHSVESRILYQVLNGFSSVRNLQLSGLTLKPAKESPDMLQNFLKPFLSLRYVRLGGFTDGSCVGPVRDLLESSHLVEGLVLGINHFPTYKDRAGLHKCFSQLKWIEIYGVTGKQEELEVLKFISETAILLEDFTVKADDKFSLKTRREQASFSFKIHSLPKSSLTVEILFVV